jgi:hypothetical protein
MGLPGGGKISARDAEQGLSKLLFDEWHVIKSGGEVRKLIEDHGYQISRCFHVIWDDLVEQRRQKNDDG